MLYINESSVRANRSRIRKKMKIGRKTDLKARLRMLMGEKNDNDANNFQRKDDDNSKY